MLTFCIFWDKTQEWIILLPSCHAKGKFQMMTLSLLHRKELCKFCSSRGEVVPGLGTSWILEWCYCAFKFQHLRSSCSSCSFSHVGWGADRAGTAWIVGPAAHAPCNQAGCACWLWTPGAFVELPASAENACAAAALLLGFSLPANPRHVVSTAEGWGASGRREMYPSQPQNLVSLFIWHVFWKSLGKGFANMGGDEKLLRYWKV